MKAAILFCAIVLALLLGALSAAYADSATWSMNPISGDWNTPANWTPNTVPNGPLDVATFAVSNTTDVSLASSIEVNEIAFDAGASEFRITASPGLQLTLSGVGVTSGSEATQRFVADADEAGNLGTITFANSAAVEGDALFITKGRTSGSLFDGGTILFIGTSSAGRGVFVNSGGTGFLGAGGIIQFSDNSTAGNGMFTTNGAAADTGQGGAITRFLSTSSAGHGTFITNATPFSGALGGLTKFFDSSTAADGVFVAYGAKVAGSGIGMVQFFASSTAGNGTFTANGAEVSGGAGAFIDFFVTSSAGNGTFTNNGGLVSGATGGTTDFARVFGGTPTADNATFINNGGLTGGAGGGVTQFYGAATAASATLIANSGIANGGDGGTIQFLNRSTGETCRVEVFGNGSLSIGAHAAPGITIGSIEGDGLVFLRSNNLTVGSNNLNTTFAGLIQGPGSITKTGTGTLTLSSANRYGGTTVSEGALILENTIGSGTGTGAVTVVAGTLGGSGIIAGAVTIGTGSGTGAFLVPAAGTNVQATLTIQSALTFNADATYTYTFKKNRNGTRTDQVIANGVTINGGAMIALSGHTRAALRQGAVLTLISNTSASPISGTFSNLPDGGIVTINGNNFQVSYEGGDGNDLTLTVVP